MRQLGANELRSACLLCRLVVGSGLVSGSGWAFVLANAICVRAYVVIGGLRLDKESSLAAGHQVGRAVAWRLLLVFLNIIGRTYCPRSGDVSSGGPRPSDCEMSVP